MLLILDETKPNLYDANTKVDGMEYWPAWQVAMRESRLCDKAWFACHDGQGPRVSVFGTALPEILNGATIKDMFWVLQKHYWNFKYGSWVVGAVSRLVDKTDWTTRIPTHVVELRNIYSYRG